MPRRRHVGGDQPGGHDVGADVVRAPKRAITCASEISPALEAA